MGKSGRHKRGKQGHSGKRGRQHGQGGWSGGGGRAPRQVGERWLACACLPGLFPACRCHSDLDKYNASPSSTLYPLQQASAGLEYESEEDGLLHIGGVVVRVDAAGGGTASIPLQQQQQQQQGGGGGGSSSARRQRRRSGSGPPPQRPQHAGSSGAGSSSDGDEEMDEREQAIQDYLANLAAGEAEGEEEEGGSGSSGSEADTEGDRHSGPGSAAKRRRHQVGLPRNCALRTGVVTSCMSCCQVSRVLINRSSSGCRQPHYASHVPNIASAV